MTKAAASRDFRPVPLNVKLTANVTSTLRPFNSRNVIARLDGSDPKLRNEAILYSAHHDHLGIGTPDANGDRIYNGAIDNASGTSLLLEMARVWANTKPAPKRSVIFNSVAAEEQGLLGSQWLRREPDDSRGPDRARDQLRQRLRIRQSRQRADARHRAHDVLSGRAADHECARSENRSGPVAGAGLVLPLRSLQLRQGRHPGVLDRPGPRHHRQARGSRRRSSPTTTARITITSRATSSIRRGTGHRPCRWDSSDSGSDGMRRTRRRNRTGSRATSSARRATTGASRGELWVCHRRDKPDCGASPSTPAQKPPSADSCPRQEREVDRGQPPEKAAVAIRLAHVDPPREKVRERRDDRAASAGAHAVEQLAPARLGERREQHGRGHVRDHLRQQDRNDVRVAAQEAAEVEGAQSFDDDEGEEEERNDREIDREQSPAQRDRAGDQCGDCGDPRGRDVRDLEQHEQKTDRAGGGDPASRGGSSTLAASIRCDPRIRKIAMSRPHAFHATNGSIVGDELSGAPAGAVIDEEVLRIAERRQAAEEVRGDELRG